MKKQTMGVAESPVKGKCVEGLGNAQNAEDLKEEITLSNGSSKLNTAQIADTIYTKGLGNAQSIMNSASIPVSMVKRMSAKGLGNAQNAEDMEEEITLSNGSSKLNTAQIADTPYTKGLGNAQSIMKTAGIPVSMVKRKSAKGLGNAQNAEDMKEGITLSNGLGNVQRAKDLKEEITLSDGLGNAQRTEDLKKEITLSNGETLKFGKVLPEPEASCSCGPSRPESLKSLGVKKIKNMKKVFTEVNFSTLQEEPGTQLVNLKVFEDFTIFKAYVKTLVYGNENQTTRSPIISFDLCETDEYVLDETIKWEKFSPRAIYAMPEEFL